MKKEIEEILAVLKEKAAQAQKTAASYAECEATLREFLKDPAVSDEKARMRLVLDVHYKPNGESVETLKGLLMDMVSFAVSRGLLTGETAAEVGMWGVRIDEVTDKTSPKPEAAKTEYAGGPTAALVEMFSRFNAKLSEAIAAREDAEFLAGCGARHLVDRMVDILNQALVLDPEAVNRLFGYAPECNAVLADHSPIVVRKPSGPGDKLMVGALGVINGMLTVLTNKSRIVAHWDKDPRIYSGAKIDRFSRLDQ